MGLADCGGGIGRVVSGVLAPLFDAVDLVEPNERFLDTARRSVDPAKLRATIAVKIQVCQCVHEGVLFEWLAASYVGMSVVCGRCHFDRPVPV